MTCSRWSTQPGTSMGSTTDRGDDMKTGWLSKERRRRVRMTEDQEVTQAVHRFALSLAEVKVIERRHQGTVTGRIVANRDALTRARAAYHHATRLVGQARQKSGTQAGVKPASSERRAIWEAI